MLIINLISTALFLRSAAIAIPVATSQDTIVTPFLAKSGYTLSTWLANPPGGCSSIEALTRIFKDADVINWTGEEKLDAIHQVAKMRNYMVIASPKAPGSCFEIVIVTNNVTKKSCEAIVIDFDHVAVSRNLADIGQNVIDNLWAGWDITKGPEMKASIAYTGRFISSMPTPKVNGKQLARKGNTTKISS